MSNKPDVRYILRRVGERGEEHVVREEIELPQGFMTFSIELPTGRFDLRGREIEGITYLEVYAPNGNLHLTTESPNAWRIFTKPLYVVD